MSPTLGENNRESFGDRQFVVIASEKQARVVALPSQTCIYRQQIVDSDFVVKAETISIKGNVVSIIIVLYIANIPVYVLQTVYVSCAMYRMDTW